MAPPASTVETTDPADRVAFGEFLRQARERRRLTLEQIAQDTKISSKHLDALEQGNVKALPSGMYRRAMLRAYAESVGLDKETALDQFERTFEPRERASAPRQPAPVRASRTPEAAAIKSSQRDARVLLVIVAVAATAAVGLIGGDPAPEPPAAAQASAPVSVTPVTNTPTAAAIPAETRPAATNVAAPVAAPAAVPAPRQQDAVASLPAAPARSESEAVTATTGRSETVAALPPPSPSATEGQIVVVTEPPGARVTVNGTGWGVSPVTVPHLPFGAKRVRVTRDGYTSQERVVTVSPGRPSATVRLTLEPR